MRKYLPFLLFMLSCAGNRIQEKNVFRYNQADGIASLDPAFAKNQPVMWASRHLFNTLVEVDDSLKLVPGLAQQWWISEDGKRYRFLLRKGVYFHDDPVFPDGRGREMKADDVVFSLNRILDKQVASPGAWIFNGRVDTLNPFIAVNDSLFELRLLRPFPPVLGILSMAYCSIVAREAVEKYGKDFRRHPCGTGPFMLKQWDEGQALILHRNPRYHERDEDGHPLPYLSAIKISFFTNKATEFMEFRQGRLDFVNDIEASFKDEILTKTGSLRKDWEGRIILKKQPYLNTEYLGILFDPENEWVKSSPLRLKKVRQAMSHAIDRKKMMMYLRNSIGIAATAGFIPAGMPGFDSTRVKGYGYDPDRARALLKEAGYHPDSSGTILLKTIPIYAELGAFVARQLEEIGMKVAVETMQRATLLEQIATSRALFFRGNWIADYPDAENYLSVFYSRNPAPPNYTRYKNAEFDRLYEKALFTTDDSERFRLYQQMDQLVMDDAPVIPLWYDMAIHLVAPGITGFTPNALNLLELRRTRKQD